MRKPHNRSRQSSLVTARLSTKAEPTSLRLRMPKIINKATQTRAQEGSRRRIRESKRHPAKPPAQTRQDIQSSAS